MSLSVYEWKVSDVPYNLGGGSYSYFADMAGGESCRRCYLHLLC
jgi:hypothetical protein